MLAEDEPALRTALADLMAAESSLELVAVAADAGEAVELARVHRPDVALLDAGMAGGGGPRAAREIGAVSSGTRVLALGTSADRGDVMAMLRAGAVGYLLKGGPVEEVVRAVHLCADGQLSLGEELAPGVLDDLVLDLRRRERESEGWRQRRRAVETVLDEGLLSVALQPIYDLTSATLAGAEALARFETPTRRPTSAWFADADAVGLGIPLELAALRAALAQLDRLSPDVYLAVNLSSRTAMSPLVAELLADAPVERLVLELTEHAEVQDYEGLRSALSGLRDRGMRVAIDDAGYSSLRHVLHLDADFVKLDVRLTPDIERDPSSRALASALIAFTAETGASVVAQGVETAEELATVAALDVAQAQGFYLGRPGSLEALLEARRPSRLAPRPHHQSLRVGFELYRSAFEEAPVGMAVTDGEGTLLAVNKALRGMVGRSAEALAGTAASDVTHPDDWDTEASLRARALSEDGVRSHGEVRLLDAGGGVRWTRTRISVARDGQGRALRPGGATAQPYLVRHVEDVGGGRSDDGHAVARLLGKGDGREETGPATAGRELSRALAGASPDHEAVLSVVAERVALLMGDLCLVGLLSDDGDWLEQAAFHHLDPETRVRSRRRLEGRRQRADEGLAALVAQEGRAVRCLAPRGQGWSPIAGSALPLLEGMAVHSLLAAPLLVRGRMTGIVAVGRDGTGPPYVEGDEVLLQDLVDRAALAVDNGRLFRAMTSHLAERARVEEELDRSRRTLHHVDQERRALLAHLVEAQEAERQRIAGDVHDDSVQAVAALSIRLQLLRRRLKDPQDLELLTSLEETVQFAIGRLRRLLFHLRADVLDSDGIAAALRLWLHEFFDPAEVTWDVEAHLDVEPPPDTATILYRIALEALVNVRKHARAKAVRVLLGRRDGGFWVRVSDDGVGFNPGTPPPRSTHHVGLLSMRERAALAGGWHQVRSAPGRGTTVELWVPSQPTADGGP